MENSAESHGDNTRLNGCAYASIAVLLLFLAGVTVIMGGIAFLLLHRSHGSTQSASTTIVVKHPIFMSGPSIEMALPAGSDLTSATVNTEGGNWWYENADSGHVRLLIAASRIGSRQPAVTDSYLQRVIRIVEQTGEDQIVSMGGVQETRVDSYAARMVSYQIQPIDGGSEHAVALLIRRESDDLLIILYGDSDVKDAIDHASEQMFESLHPRPTPDRYDVHSARTIPPQLVVSARTHAGAII
ncbi:MAG: hypothetical protein WBW04_19170 [Nitrolancea sp.]